MIKPNIDCYERKIDYLRVSVTDRCDLRCIYCMPIEGVKLVKYGDILRYEEIVKIVQIAAEIGIRKIRLTGGESLVRKNLPRLVAELSSIPQIEEISMTTNGMTLAQHAQNLANSGLDRVNISLDTMKPERFKTITRFGNLSDVWQGIHAAEDAGLTPIKLNVIPMRGINDDEIADFVMLTMSHPWSVRFIELMKFPYNQAMQDRYFISAEEILEKLSSLGIPALRQAAPQKSFPGNGPARHYKLPGAIGEIGIISPVTQHFCHSCNRLRLTADGKLRPCLLSDKEFDLRSVLRNGTSDDQLRNILHDVIRSKPESQETEKQENEKIGNSDKDQKRAMSQIGG